ncbi:unnamed protein product, partial [Porites evermanni]
MKKDGHEGLEVQSCGFLTSKTHRLGWLRKGICNKNGIINKSHQYYYQIQQQEFVTDRTWCDFVVRGSNNELFQQRVPFNT